MDENDLGVSLEQQPAAIVGPVSEAAPVADPGDEDQTPSGTIEGSGGVKFVPLDAVLEARGKTKNARAELATARAQIATMERDVADYAALKPRLAEAMPIIEAVRRRPDLVRQAFEPPPAPVPPAGPLTEAEALDYAKDLDLYGADGQPDTARAQRLAGKQQALMERHARAAIAPYEQRTAEQQAGDLRHRIGQMKDAQGRTVDAAALDQVFGAIPPELASRPEVASVLYYAAKGYAEHHAKGRATAPPLVVSEALGSGRPETGLTALDERFRVAADIKPADFQKTGARFVAGHSNSLE